MIIEIQCFVIGSLTFVTDYTMEGLSTASPMLSSMASSPMLSSMTSSYVNTTDFFHPTHFTTNHHLPYTILQSPTQPTTASHPFAASSTTTFKNVVHKSKLKNSRPRKTKHNDRSIKLHPPSRLQQIQAAQNHHNSGVESSVRINSSGDMSTLTYVTLVCVFYGAALIALFISLCCRRRQPSLENSKDSQEYYENYMRNKERVYRLSLMQRLKRIRRLWDAADLYKMPVNII